MTTEKENLLGIYLNDHLAGAAAGVELARRLASAEKDEPYGPALQELAREIEDDRSLLRDMMNALGVPVRTYKTWLGWAAAKVGTLKPNGRLLTRSPLSRVIELEALRLGVEGKAACWRTLRVRSEHDARLDSTRLDSLIKRAGMQVDELGQLRVLAAAQAFGGDRTSVH
ncbi:hypothetical protein ALI144C_06745 [Actinosynnema sp. ALI-1.44]|uniref:hypothetical protein n=1 Tax=Actinosynnema sp. ALI-1.44 TaxID=1933779 RepID=UPI00097BCF4B|nr:hypothetical protein [Actinosynnema sp. ALI-1.44]ONI88712.1 hypothetical protein ALI144C_06745 [Actinosynnema sp. ALI-1.44]